MHVLDTAGIPGRWLHPARDVEGKHLCCQLGICCSVPEPQQQRRLHINCRRQPPPGRPPDLQHAARRRTVCMCSAAICRCMQPRSVAAKPLLALQARKLYVDGHRSVVSCSMLPHLHCGPSGDSQAGVGRGRHDCTGCQLCRRDLRRLVRKPVQRHHRGVYTCLRHGIPPLSRVGQFPSRSALEDSRGA
jgi:hypothetical protein